MRREYYNSCYDVIAPTRLSKSTTNAANSTYPILFEPNSTLGTNLSLRKIAILIPDWMKTIWHKTRLGFVLSQKRKIVFLKTVKMQKVFHAVHSYCESHWRKGQITDLDYCSNNQQRLGHLGTKESVSALYAAFFLSYESTQGT